MKKLLVPFGATHQFSSLIDEYLTCDKNLETFYRFAPEPSSFEKAIRLRSEFPCNRQVLCDRLFKQYGSLLDPANPHAQNVRSSVTLLRNENCFTVTTGHQLNIFTGPLYSIYKIATTIKLAKELSKQHTSNSFVPVFWMATEDHDFDEINHTNIFGKQVSWNREPGGAVGRMNTIGMQEVLQEAGAIIGGDGSCLKIFEDAYLSSATLAEATRKIVHALFGEHGLVIIDGDDAELKKLFAGEMRDDLVSHKSFNAVNETSAKLSKIHKIQVQPRQINLFYLGDNSRERIVQNEDRTYGVLNTEIQFTADELMRELDAHPEKFSPNVVLRPLYQEKVLPNLAYIGGPGELQYWLQFLDAFDANKIPYPVFILRNSMLLLDKGNLSRMEKLGLTVNELFMSADYLVLKVLESSSEVHIGTEHITAMVQNAFQELGGTWLKLDPSLVPAVEAEKHKTIKAISVLEEKARRAMKKKNESLVNQVKNLKDKLFPGGGLQERSENFLPFYCQQGQGFINEIIDQSNPFERQFIVLMES